MDKLNLTFSNGDILESSDLNMIVNKINELIDEHKIINGEKYQVYVTLNNNEIQTYQYVTSSIPNRAFSGDTNIIDVVINSNITDIGDDAFSHCTSLTSITIPNSVVEIGIFAFDFCSLASIVIPDSVTSIGNYAFQSCSKLTTVIIGSGVTSIGENVFNNCTSLTSVTYNGEECLNVYTGYTVKYSSRDSSDRNVYKIIYRTISIPSISYIYNIEEVTQEIITNLTVTGTSIENGTFSGCTSLVSVIIPDSVTSIGVKAFYACSSLTSVTIGNGVTSIGSWVFASCGSLVSVVIPNSVTNIGYYAFLDCSGITSITYNGTIEQWNNITKEDTSFVYYDYVSAYTTHIIAATVHCTDGDITLS